jgi:ribosomal protein S18 acetylase RimI-like enzyme
MLLRIADCEPSQSRAVVELWRASFEHAMGLTDPHPIEQQHAFFVDELMPKNRVRTAWLGDDLVGFMASTPESVSQLFVRVDHIGRFGIGSTLLNRAKAESAGSLWLYAFVRNANACRFYERHGFVETERESENMWKLEAIRYAWHGRIGGDPT